jgi:hypothetical protein
MRIDPKSGITNACEVLHIIEPFGKIVKGKKNEPMLKMLANRYP